jgi:hypothetical protein
MYVGKTFTRSHSLKVRDSSIGCKYSVTQRIPAWCAEEKTRFFLLKEGVAL